MEPFYTSPGLVPPATARRDGARGARRRAPARGWRARLVRLETRHRQERRAREERVMSRGDCTAAEKTTTSACASDWLQTAGLSLFTPATSSAYSCGVKRPSVSL